MHAKGLHRSIWSATCVGTIPKELGNLAFLQELDLGFNSLTGETQNTVDRRDACTVISLIIEAVFRPFVGAGVFFVCTRHRLHPVCAFTST